MLNYSMEPMLICLIVNLTICYEWYEIVKKLLQTPYSKEDSKCVFTEKTNYFKVMSVLFTHKYSIFFEKNHEDAELN